MPSWWSYRPVDVQRKQRADDFSEFVDEQIRPPEPKPWDVPETPDEGMPVGPDAARRFDERANRQRQLWQQAMLNAIAPVPAATPTPTPTPTAPPGASPAPDSADGPSPWPAWPGPQPAPTPAPTAEPTPTPTPTPTPGPVSPPMPSPFQQAASRAIAGVGDYLANRPPSAAARAVLPGGTSGDLDQAAAETVSWFGAGRSPRPNPYFEAGAGDVAQTMAGAARTVGRREDAAAFDRWASEQRAKAPPAEQDLPISAENLVNPEFYRTTVARQIPGLATIVGAGLLGGLVAPEVGAAAGVATAAYQAAGSTYNQAIAKGMDPARAQQAGLIALAGNLALAPGYIVGLPVVFSGLGTGVKQKIVQSLLDRFGPETAAGAARTIGGAEAAAIFNRIVRPEVRAVAAAGELGSVLASGATVGAAGDIINRVALGEPVAADEQLGQSAGMGALLFGGTHAVGSVARALGERGIRPGMTVEDVTKQREAVVDWLKSDPAKLLSEYSVKRPPLTGGEPRPVVFQTRKMAQEQLALYPEEQQARGAIIEQGKGADRHFWLVNIERAAADYQRQQPVPPSASAPGMTVEDVSGGTGGTSPRTYDAYLRNRATVEIAAYEKQIGGLKAKLRYEQPGMIDYDHDTRQVEFYQKGIEQYRSYLAGGPEPNRAYWPSEYGNVKGALEVGVQVPDALLAKYPEAVKEVQSQAPRPPLSPTASAVVQPQEAQAPDPQAALAALTYKPSDLYGSKQLYTGTVDGQMVWSNGHIVEFRDVPPKVERMKGWTARYPNKDIGGFLNARPIEHPVAATPVMVGSSQDGPTVVLATGPTGMPLERFRVLSAPYFAYFQTAYPGATYTTDAKNPDRPVRVDAGGKTVGYILPIGQTNESALRVARLVEEQTKGAEPAPVPAGEPPVRAAPGTVETAAVLADYPDLAEKAPHRPPEAPSPSPQPAAAVTPQPPPGAPGTAPTPAEQPAEQPAAAPTPVATDAATTPAPTVAEPAAPASPTAPTVLPADKRFRSRLARAKEDTLRRWLDDYERDDQAERVAAVRAELDRRAGVAAAETPAGPPAAPEAATDRVPAEVPAPAEAPAPAESPSPADVVAAVEAAPAEAASAAEPPTEPPAEADGTAPPGPPSPPPVNPQITPPPQAPPPNRLIARFLGNGAIEQAITAGGILRSIGQAVHTTPIARDVVHALAPWATAMERQEMPALVYRYLEADAANYLKQAGYLLAAKWPKTVTIDPNGIITRGATPKRPGQSLAWGDVFEHLDQYDVVPELTAFVKLQNRIVDEAFDWAAEEGVKVRRKDFGTGHYFGRLVLEVREAEKQRRARPDMPRAYDEMAGGLAKGVVYSTDPLATTGAVLSYALRRIISRRLTAYAAELGKTPNELIPQAVRDRFDAAKAALAIAGRYEKALAHVRDNLTLHYTMTTTPQGAPSTVVRKEFRDIEAAHPGTIARVAAARAPLDAKLKAGQSLTKGDRTAAFGELVDEAKAWKKQAADAYKKALAVRATARQKLEAPEPHIEGAPFGRPGETINLGHVRQGWASGRLFEKETAAFLDREVGQQAMGWISMVNSANSVVRTLQSSFDTGAMFIHLSTLMLNPTAMRTGGWPKAAYWMLRSFAQPESFAAFMANPVYQGLINKYRPYGLGLEGAEYMEAAQPGGPLEQVVHGVAVGTGKAARLGGPAAEETTQHLIDRLGKTILHRFDLLFLAPLNVGKLEMLRALDPIATRTGEYAELAMFVNNATGTFSSLAHGIGPNQRGLEGAFGAYSPRLLRSVLAIIGDASTKGGLRGGEARKALGSVLAASVLLPLALRLLKGEPPDRAFLDPNDRDFLTAEWFDRKVGLSGTYKAILLTLQQSIRAAIVEGKPEVFLAPFDRENNPFARFWAGRTTPVTALLWDALSKRDFMGEPLVSAADWVKYGIEHVVPFPVQEYVRQAIDLKPGETRLPIGGLIPEFLGLKATPKSPAERRDDLRDTLAREAYGKPWYPPRENPAGGLAPSEQLALERAHPEIGSAADFAQTSAADRGQVAAQFWRQVEATRSRPHGPQEQIAALGEQLRAGTISGNAYRKAVAEQERELAQVPITLKTVAQWRAVPITAAERTAAYGDRYPQSTHPEAMFIETYYLLAEAAKDPQTGVVDPERLSNYRDALKAKTAPDVVAGAMAVINQHRDPEYVRAQESFRAYLAIPRWIGVTAEHAKELADAQQALRNITDQLPAGFPNKTAYGLAQLQRTKGSAVAALANEAGKRLANPARRAFWQAHPELTKFYSDVPWGDLIQVPGAAPVAVGR